MAGAVTFRPTAQDYLSVARGNFLRSLTRGRFRVRLAIGLCGSIVIGAAAGLLETGTVHIGWIVFAAGVLAGWLILVLGGTYLMIPRRSQRLFRQHRSLDHDFTISWDERGMTQSWEQGSMRTPWTDYHGWFERADLFAFGLTEQLYHFVPKRGLAPEQAADLRAAATAIAGQVPRA